MVETNVMNRFRANGGQTNTPDVLNTHFNAAVLAVVNSILPQGFDVADEAPNTFEALKEHFGKTGRILVWSGASERTIFGDAEINYAFRAWHDYWHLKLNAPFTPDGEKAVRIAQQADILRLYGYSAASSDWCGILEAEVDGQLAYKDMFGHFPANQIGFVRAYLSSKAFALAMDWG